MTHIANSCFKSRLCANPSALEPATYLGRHPPTTPSTTWTYVSIGFVHNLPPCINPDGHRACSVVVFMDRLSRQARFVAASENPSPSEVASLFNTHVQGRFGPPKALLWDRDPEASPDDSDREFWRKLCLLLQVPVSTLPQNTAESGSYMNSSTSSGNHINSPPMAAAANRRIVEQLIRGHAHHLPDTWASFLPLAEAAYNGAAPSAISCAAAPLIARFGGGLLPGSAPGSPRGSREVKSAAQATSVTLPGAATPQQPSSPTLSSTAMKLFQLREIPLRAQKELQSARARYSHRKTISSSRSSTGTGTGSMISSASSTLSTASVSTFNSFSSNSSTSTSVESASCNSSNGSLDTDHWCPDPRFQVGDRVRLSTTDLCLPDQPTMQLRPGYLGPFTILEVVSPAAYRLELPPSLGRLHPVIHVSRLMPWTDPEGRSLPPVPPPQPPPSQSPWTPQTVPRAASAPTGLPNGSALGSPSEAFSTDPDLESVLDTGGDGDVVTGVRVSQAGVLHPTIMFHIRWAVPKEDGRSDGWEPYSAVEQLPAVREYLKGRAWREWKQSDMAQRFLARWPERMPRLVRFER